MKLLTPGALTNRQAQSLIDCIKYLLPNSCRMVLRQDRENPSTNRCFHVYVSPRYYLRAQGLMRAFNNGKAAGQAETWRQQVTGHE